MRWAIVLYKGEKIEIEIYDARVRDMMCVCAVGVKNMDYL